MIPAVEISVDPCLVISSIMNGEASKYSNEKHNANACSGNNVALDLYLFNRVISNDEGKDQDSEILTKLLSGNDQGSITNKNTQYTITDCPEQSSLIESSSVTKSTSLDEESVSDKKEITAKATPILHKSHSTFASVASKDSPSTVRRTIFGGYWTKNSDAPPSPLSVKADHLYSRRPEDHNSYRGHYSFDGTLTAPQANNLLHCPPPISKILPPKSILRRSKSEQLHKYNKRTSFGVGTCKSTPNLDSKRFASLAESSKQEPAASPNKSMLANFRLTKSDHMLAQLSSVKKTESEEVTDQDQVLHSSNLKPHDKMAIQGGKGGDQHLVQFDPRISVMEYGFMNCSNKATRNEYRRSADSGWFTVEELEGFKVEAIMLAQRLEIMSCNEKSFGKKRSVSVGGALFTNPALQITEEDQLIINDSQELHALLTSQIRYILVVEPLEAFQTLFVRGIKQMFPFANVQTARNGQEALHKVKHRTYDIVIVEERLQLPYLHDTDLPAEDKDDYMTGSMLMQRICQFHKQNEKLQNRWPLLIGVSARLGEDCDKLQRGGADIFWGKPPPSMNKPLRNQILTAVLRKRGQESVIFG